MRMNAYYRMKICASCFAGAVLLMTVGCSTFHREWRSATADSGPVDDISGRWQGSWMSNVNRHHGRLRAVLAKEEPARYQARFHASFWKVFSYTYTVPLQAHETN